MRMRWDGKNRPDQDFLSQNGIKAVQKMNRGIGIKIEMNKILPGMYPAVCTAGSCSFNSCFKQDA